MLLFSQSSTHLCLTFYLLLASFNKHSCLWQRISIVFKILFFFYLRIFKRILSSTISSTIPLQMIFFNFLTNYLIADVPFSVIIPCLSARICNWILILRNRMVREAKLDLCCLYSTLSNFCSWVSSFSKFLGTDTLAFQFFFLSPRWSGSIRLLISSLMVFA